MPSRSAVLEKQKSSEAPLNDDELRLLNAYWHAANYLCVGMLYLRDNPYDLHFRPRTRSAGGVV